MHPKQLTTVVFSDGILSYQKFIFYKFSAPTKKNVDLEKVYKNNFQGYDHEWF